MLREVLEPDGLERGPGPRRALLARHALEHHPEIDVLEHRAPGKQRALLEHEGDLARHRSGDPLARDLDRAGRRRDQAADDVEQRRLATAARPDQAEELAARDVERGVAQRAHVAGLARLAELMRDVLDPDRRLAASSHHPPPTVMISSPDGATTQASCSNRTVVVPCSWMSAGPAIRAPAASVPR